MRKKYEIKTTSFDKKGRVIATAFNDYFKSNPWQKTLSVKSGLSEHRICLHSEVSCILKSRTKTIHTILIERYDVHGNPKVAFPCPSCQLAIKLTKIKKVIFTTEEGKREWIV